MNENKKIAFLVLHYKNINETIECTNSILKNLNYKKYDIVIVDNGSNNNTGEELLERYKENNNIHVIISHENLGFAKGNNLGFKYIKENLKSEFIAMINSDTIIEQREFCQKIIEKYNKYKFDICGMDILLPNGQHTNPTLANVHNVKDIKKTIRNHKKNIVLYKLNLGVPYQIFRRIKTKFKKLKIDYEKEIQDVIGEKFQLHGAAIIFSENFIRNYDGLYDGTFLYFEEVALRYIADRDNLKVIYTPDIKIIHKMSITTKKLYKNWKERHIFYSKNAINSAINVLNYIESDKESTWKKE